jgi:hypothetical protein
VGLLDEAGFFKPLRVGRHVNPPFSSAGSRVLQGQTIALAANASLKRVSSSWHHLLSFGFA